MAPKDEVKPDTAESVAASKTTLVDEAGSPVHEGQPGYEHAKALADLNAKHAVELEKQAAQNAKGDA